MNQKQNDQQADICPFFKAYSKKEGSEFIGVTVLEHGVNNKRESDRKFIFVPVCEHDDLILICLAKAEDDLVQIDSL